MHAADQIAARHACRHAPRGRASLNQIGWARWTGIVAARRPGRALVWSSKMSEMIYGDGAIRRPGLYGSSIENTYAGVLSFMRRTYSRELNGVDVVVSGVPLVYPPPSARARSWARRPSAPPAMQLAELKPYRGV